MEFRLNFIIRILIYFFWAGISYATVFLIYSQVDTIGGWNRDEMILLTSVVGVSNALYKTFFHRSITRLNQLVNKGDLDFMLIKPANPRFLASMRQFGFEQLPRLVMFVYLVIVLTNSQNPSINTLDLLIGFGLIILGSFSIYNMVFSIYCYVFWKPRVWNIFAINVELQNLGSNPSQIYKGGIGLLIYILPIAVYATIPTLVLLNGLRTEMILYSVIITISFSIISIIIWKAGLKKYESASS